MEHLKYWNRFPASLGESCVKPGFSAGMTRQLFDPHDRQAGVILCTGCSTHWAAASANLRLEFHDEDNEVDGSIPTSLADDVVRARDACVKGYEAKLTMYPGAVPGVRS